MIPVVFAPSFGPRAEPLAPVAAAVPRARCNVLVDRWHRDASEIGGLHAVATSSTLLLFGEEDALPWVDGVVYLGRDPGAPRLFVPTALAPDLPMALLERALFARWPGARAPAALLLDPLRLADGLSPTPFDLASLEAWLARTP
jgi:hypothetical protein